MTCLNQMSSLQCDIYVYVGFLMGLLRDDIRSSSKEVGYLYSDVHDWLLLIKIALEQNRDVTHYLKLYDEKTISVIKSATGHHDYIFLLFKIKDMLAKADPKPV